MKALVAEAFGVVGSVIVTAEEYGFGLHVLIVAHATHTLRMVLRRFVRTVVILSRLLLSPRLRFFHKYFRFASRLA